MTPGRQAWLSLFSWDFVTAQNKALCAAKAAHHGRTSDGHDRTRELWEERHREAMSLEEAVDLCRRCHHLAPFCFYNGNTFTAIVRTVISRLDLEEAKGFAIRSLAGHIVAGVATDEEKQAFKQFSDSLLNP